MPARARVGWGVDVRFWLPYGSGMQDVIYFEHNGGKVGDFKTPAEGWLALGSHRTRPGALGETHLLSPGCMSGPELREQGERLKAAIDKAVSNGCRSLAPEGAK